MQLLAEIFPLLQAPSPDLFTEPLTQLTRDCDLAHPLREPSTSPSAKWVPTTFQATVCTKHQPFCHDLKISFYEPIVVSPETIHQCHLVTR